MAFENMNIEGDTMEELQLLWLCRCVNNCLVCMQNIDILNFLGFCIDFFQNTHSQ